ncbi:MAG: hypothetical protein ACPGVF_08355, partial [Flavobacteriaceae bacterium]
MKHFIIFLFSVLLLNCQNPTKKVLEPKVIAPFTNLDTISTNDWWNRAENPILNVKVPREEVIAFGIYTVSDDVLKLTAQLFPLYPDEDRAVRLALKSDGQWNEVAQETINDLGWNATFRIENWDAN